jgi:hypothetical protein
MGATANAFGRVQGQRLQSIRNLEHFPMDLRATELHLYVFSSQRRGMARARRPTRLPLPFGTYLCVIVKSGKGAGLMTHFCPTSLLVALPVRGLQQSRRREAGHRGELDNDASPVTSSPKKGLQIRESQVVWEFYDRGFKYNRQTACREIAKAFIKLIAPKKQTNNPYLKGDGIAPDWWPKPWGPGEKDKARHVEPDHLRTKGW